jgi:hypothetical protein
VKFSFVILTEVVWRRGDDKLDVFVGNLLDEGQIVLASEDRMGVGGDGFLVSTAGIKCDLLSSYAIRRM